MRIFFLFTTCWCLLSLPTTHLSAQNHLSVEGAIGNPLKSVFVYPTRIVWQSGSMTGQDNLLQAGPGQASLDNRHIAVLKNEETATSSILLDFGKELQGSVEFITGMWGGNAPRNIRVRFGESVAEAMSEVGENGSTNDHAMRDFKMQLPWLGKNQTGSSGFRFVRIDFLDTHAELLLKEVRAVFYFRDIPYIGTFKSSDERLNKIWEVGAYTVHLNMQDYLWDGIKRDRLVWVGDLHPEVATVNAVFGYNEVVPKSLDLARDVTPLPGWMCGISTYSMWWIILQHDWYMHYGKEAYLHEQKSYLQGLVRQIVAKVKNGTEQMDGTRFLDWPSSEDSIAVHQGIQAMTILALEKASILLEILKDAESKKLCDETIVEMRKYTPELKGSKQAAALLSLTNLVEADKAYQDVLKVGGAKNFSTFFGYYMLEAMAKAGRYQEAMDVISDYWGGMLDLGATTFWEDFDMDWLQRAGRIDELVPSDKIDVHGTYGNYCYKGYRHSLCHGWASGPTAWLSAHVLGIQVAAPGGKVFKIDPHLGNLTYAEGTYPTPYGTIHVKHTKNAKGQIRSEISAPKNVKIVR